MNFESETNNKAEFNMAVSYLNRLNILLTACDSASINLDIYSWFHSLLAINRELSTWMDDEEIAAFNKTVNEINPMLNQLYKRGMKEIDHKLYMKLHNMEIDLRKIADKSGLMMKMADDAMDALK
jgi:hypothetical protein